MATVEKRQQPHHPPPNGVTTEVRAVAKYVRTAPRKAMLVVEEIRGLTVPQARTALAFMPRAAARDVEDVLRSAVANAEANHGLAGDDLYVSAAVVGAGPTLKRWRARARGRVGRIRKRTCHITIRLAPVEAAAPQAQVKAVEAEGPRRARARKAEEPVAAAETKAVEEAPAAQAPAETAPAAEKPKRARRPKAAPVEAEAAPPAGEKQRRGRARAPEAAAGTGGEEPAAKPRRSRKKADETSPEGGE